MDWDFLISLRATSKRLLDSLLYYVFALSAPMRMRIGSDSVKWKGVKRSFPNDKT